MKLTGVSLFAGVGGFDLAMERAGVQVVASVEIDKHARGILEKHFPTSKLFNDVTEVTGEQLRESGFTPSRGILTGGFPCQDLSIAGKRAGLDGARSGLYWQITRLIDETEPEWVVLENVPGLLTSSGGADMGAVIGALADRGYGVGWRVLDAQNFGVPQRRRRVFIVARRAGDITSVAKVLFERQGLRGNHPSSRAQGQETTRDAGQGIKVASGDGLEPDYGDTVFDQSFRMDGVRTYEGVSQSLNARMGTGGNNVPLKVEAIAFDGYNQTLSSVSQTIRADRSDGDHVGMVLEAETYVKVIRSGARDADGNLPPEVWREEETNPTLNQFDQGDSRTVVAIVEPIVNRLVGFGDYRTDGTFSTTQSRDYKGATGLIVEPIAVQGSVVGRSDTAGPGGKGHGEEGDPMSTLNTIDRHAVANAIVRRLTPMECERLQGFPDGWTADQADSHRYKQMGNAVAVPVVEWIINGIVEVMNEQA
ncbi:MAG: DNA (cytosine-5-)-methyltransferase [Betaproteobacteria bacterium]|nr:DNA (cytosine-5-)-methyltransferase [Betaproteobacteria bacterium]